MKRRARPTFSRGREGQRQPCRAFVPHARPRHAAHACSLLPAWRSRCARCDGADCVAALSRSADAATANRSAQSAALPEIRPAGARRNWVRPLAFTPPASAAGDTGFDSTNSRSAKAKGKAKAKIAQRMRRRSRPESPAPAPVSRLPETGGQLRQRRLRRGARRRRRCELGPIRQPPKKRKAHTRARRSLRAARRAYRRLHVVSGDRADRRLRHQSGARDRCQGRLALYRRAGTAGAVELVAPRAQGRSARQLHRLQPRRHADAEPALFQRQGRRPHRRHQADAHRSRHAACWCRPTIPAARICRPDLAKLPIFTTLAAAPASASASTASNCRSRAMPSAPSISNSTLTDGSTASNDDRNYNQYGGTLRGGYELSPGVTPFVEVGADTRVHDLNSDFSGYQRNSKGLTGKVGSTFELSRHAHRRNRRSAICGEITRTRGWSRLKGLIGDASLVWTATALTTVKLDRQIGGRRIDRPRRLRRALPRRRFAGRSCVPALADRHCEARFRARRLCRARPRPTSAYSAGLGLTYKLNRSVQIKGEVPPGLAALERDRRRLHGEHLPARPPASALARRYLSPSRRRSSPRNSGAMSGRSNP